MLQTEQKPSPVRRTALRWHGGKWKLAPWILQHLPRHRVYVEPYGGAASVLLRKPRSYAEVYNDLDEEVVNLFRVLRDEEMAAKLQKLLHLTPFAREEFASAYKRTKDPVERARRLIIISFMGFGSNGHNTSNATGFRSNSNRSGTTPAKDWMNYPEGVADLVERMRGVVIENRDAFKVMEQHDTPQTLHYVDPPYVWATRTTSKKGTRGYRFEMDDDQHRELCRFLCDLEGMVVLSGYPNDVYEEELMPEWVRVDCRAFADGALERTECLWLNPAAWQAHQQEQGRLL